jgi:hypothetical protein
MAIFVTDSPADSENGKVMSHDFPRFQPKFYACRISNSQRERDGGSVSGTSGHQAPGVGHQTPDTWILSALYPPTRCCLTPAPPRRLDYSGQRVSPRTQTLVNLILTGPYRETPRSPCTSVVASSSDVYKPRLLGGAAVKHPGNHADEVDFPLPMPFSLIHGILLFSVDNRETWR